MRPLCGRSRACPSPSRKTRAEGVPGSLPTITALGILPSVTLSVQFLSQDSCLPPREHGGARAPGRAGGGAAEAPGAEPQGDQSGEWAGDLPPGLPASSV